MYAITLTRMCKLQIFSEVC